MPRSAVWREEHRQPHGVRVRCRPLDAVALVGGYQPGVARAEVDHVTVVETEPRPAHQHCHPLVFVLVVPLSRWRHVPMGHDALDTYGAALRQDFGELFGERVWGGEQVLQAKSLAAKRMVSERLGLPRIAGAVAAE